MDGSYESWARGWHEGHARAYCEMVRVGVRLAGMMQFNRRYLRIVRAVVRQQGLKSKTFDAKHQTVGFWIYRTASTRRLIDAFDTSECRSDIAVWGSGKLFGYGDTDVLSFIDRTRRMRQAPRRRNTRNRV